MTPPLNRLTLAIFFSLLPIAIANAGQVKLAWDWNGDPVILGGYKVYYGAASRTYATSLDAGLAGTPAAPTFTVDNLPDGITLYFTVTAYSLDRTVESTYSNEISTCISCSTDNPTAGFIATPTTGTAPLVVRFTDTSTPAPGNQILNWAWTFGDGKISNIQSPSNTYSNAGTYAVSLTVTDQGNRISTLTQQNYITVTTTQPPVANFTASPLSGRAPLRVTFANTSTGTITTWAWTFGDNSASAIKTPSPHTYSAAGAYTVSLKVTGPGGTTSTKTQKINVTRKR